MHSQPNTIGTKRMNRWRYRHSEVGQRSHEDEPSWVFDLLTDLREAKTVLDVVHRRSELEFVIEGRVRRPRRTLVAVRAILEAVQWPRDNARQARLTPWLPGSSSGAYR